MSLEVAYIGNHAVHLTTSYNFDSLPAQYLSRSPVRDTATINALAAIVANPFSGLLPGQTLNGSTTAVSSLLNAISGVLRHDRVQYEQRRLVFSISLPSNSRSV